MTGMTEIFVPYKALHHSARISFRNIFCKPSILYPKGFFLILCSPELFTKLAK